MIASEKEMTCDERTKIEIYKKSIIVNKEEVKEPFIDLTSNIQNIQDDEGMNDLESFNKKYGKILYENNVKFNKNVPKNTYENYYTNSECYYSLPMDLIPSKKSLISNYAFQETSNSDNCSLKFFSVKSYLKRILNHLPKEQLKNILFKINNISSNNYALMAMVRTYKKSFNKDKIIDLIINLIMIMIKK